MSKYDYNASDVMTFPNRDEIFDEFLFQIGVQEGENEIIAVITDYDLAVTIFDELCKTEGTLVRRAMFNCDTDKEFIVAYEYYTGFVSIQPVDDCEFLDSINLAYVDMDGSVSHETINMLPDSTDIILFGENDECNERYDSECNDECLHCGCYEKCARFDESKCHGFTLSFVDNDCKSDFTYYTTDAVPKNIVKKMLGAITMVKF